VRLDVISYPESIAPSLPPCDYPTTVSALLDGHHLTADAMASAIGALVDGEITQAQAGGFLTALAGKGETIDELVGTARALRERCVQVPHTLSLVVDVCGTGGDRAGTINISTCVALVVAACGLPVAKHGNRAASSRCGSADVLEYLGVPLDRSPQDAAVALASDGFAFLFAQRYHPAMKAVASVRRELGVRTIFNSVGPLANPARATHQVVGVASSEHVELVGKALQALGLQAGAVVHSESGLDEIAGEGRTAVYQFDRFVAERYYIDPCEFGISASLEALAGGDVATNAAALMAIIDGELSPRADLVALNAALALQVAGRVASLHDGVALAKRALESGGAKAVLERARQAGRR
jgi:anthranilate phosphoribosyltransferase